MLNFLKVSPNSLLIPTIFAIIICFLFLLKIAKDENNALTRIRYFAIIAIGLAIILFMLWIASLRLKYGS